MGQQVSRTSNGIYFQQKLSSLLTNKKHNSAQKPEEPIKFQYKTPKKKNKSPNFDGLGFTTIRSIKSALDGVKGFKKCTINDVKHGSTCDVYISRFNIDDRQTKSKKPNDDNKGELKNSKRRTREHRKEAREKHLPVRTKSEPNLRSERGRKRIRSTRNEVGTSRLEGKLPQFGYEIQDIDEFLTKATLSKPANIPVVLAFPSVLYQTRRRGHQTEISLPLGMVVNAIFKNQNWLYVQTPHAEEGYLSYSACLPLGIIPSSNDDQHSPCWEKSTDIFPRPSGNMTDMEKLSCQSDNEDDTYCYKTKYRTALSTCGEKSVDRLYLRAAAIARGKGTRHTLLIINEDYKANVRDCLSVTKNEVVFLLNARVKGWFYVRNKAGHEGYIPSSIAGHGFL